MSKSDTTADIAAQKIAEIEKEIAAIDVQIRARVAPLLDRKESLQRIKAAISPLAGPNGQSQFPLSTVGVAGGSGGGTYVSASGGSGGGSPNANTGFRDSVRIVLREHPKGLKPAEVIQLLGERGDLARYTGKIKPAERVYAELYALRRAEEITKRNGRYMYRPEETVNGQT